MSEAVIRDFLELRAELPKPVLGLTRRQHQLLCIIAELTDANGYCPSFEEMAQEMDLTKSNISRLVDGLVDRGWVAREKFRCRSLKVLRRPEMPSFEPDIDVTPKGHQVAQQVAR